MMALQLPRGAEREYIATSGIVAVYVAALPAGSAYVGISRDLLHTLRALRHRWPALQITAAGWVQAKSDARLICREVNSRLAQGQQGLLIANAKTAQRKVENVAAHMGIALTDHDTVLIRARAAVAHIERQIAQAQATGELQWFNRAYRSWRLQAKQYGRSMSYAEARARLRQKLFRQLLSNEVQNEPKSLFPPLPGIDFLVSG
jgi:hypothetical protein